MRQELMGRPIPVWEEALPTSTEGAGGGSKQARDVNSGTISVNFTVTERGRIRTIKTEASPVEFTDMQRMVHREIRRRVFRPQIVDGEPVESGNQEFRHDFYYRQSELDRLREEKAAAEQAAAAER